MGSLSEKPASRLNQKTLGVTNRIWLILVVFLALVLFTRSILPSDTSYYGRHKLVHIDAKPRNYLNVTEGSPVPFSFCPALGPGDELADKYDPVALQKTRLHTGTGARIQRVITRALSGLPVTISVVGGSVSACHGAGDDPLSPSCYPSRFFNWWNSVFPHPASELTNGAMRRTSSAYFSFCNAHHVPDVTDLVIVELDVDDAGDRQAMDNFELLIRSLLIRPDQPAVLILGHSSPQSLEQGGFLGPDQMHTLVAQFYDVPHISVKPLLYPMYLNSPSQVQQYFVDPILANSKGHELISDVLISYFQSQTCSAWSSAVGTAPEVIPGPGPVVYQEKAKTPTDARGLFGGVAQRKGAAGAAAPEDPEAVEAGVNANPAPVAFAEPGTRQLSEQLYPNLKVPQARIGARPADYSARSFEEVSPFCVSANDLINPLPPSMFSGSGWEVFHPPPGSAELSSHAHYWYSSLPTSKLRVGLQVGAGDIGIYYLKEPASDVGLGSAVECWVDDNYKGAVVIENSAQISDSVPTLEIIDHYVSRGSHFIECQLLGEEDDRNVPPFKIIGVFST
ncbi:SGNH/GDSL hydrolase family protein [Phanerochaete sordida]|uniref:SGNH/GDSL hydrolase family protein n=1 Tax=Phanerochaete sordida TaxID=48140 RepID=A0A9P3L9V3_9APHY|nr:SGNH/GDSL hydrolase family protein [Phanerochaete sordida]